MGIARNTYSNFIFKMKYDEEEREIRKRRFDGTNVFKFVASMFYCEHSSCKFLPILWQCNPHYRRDCDDAFGPQLFPVARSRSSTTRRVIFIFTTAFAVLNAIARCLLLVTLNFPLISMCFTSTLSDTSPFISREAHWIKLKLITSPILPSHYFYHELITLLIKVSIL